MSPALGALACPLARSRWSRLELWLAVIAMLSAADGLESGIVRKKLSSFVLGRI